MTSAIKGDLGLRGTRPKLSILGAAASTVLSPFDSGVDHLACYEDVQQA